MSSKSQTDQMVEASPEITSDTTHSKSLAVIRNINYNNEKEIVDPGISVDTLIDRGLSKELGEKLRNGLGVTDLTALQAGAISRYLNNVKGANGQSIMQDFHLATGPGAGRTLTHAIMVVDHLIKFREWVEALTLNHASLVDETYAESNCSPVFNTGTFHAMIVCITRRRTKELHELYEMLCQGTDIAVSRFRKLQKHESIQPINEKVKASGATIAIVSKPQFHAIMKAFDNNGASADGIRDESNGTDPNAIEHDTLNEAQRFFADTKVVVFEDNSLQSDEEWKVFLYASLYHMRLFLSSMTARVVVSERDLYDGYDLFANDSSDGMTSRSRYIEVRDTPATKPGKTVPWQVRPHLVAHVRWLTQNFLSHGLDNMANEVARQLGLHNRSYRRTRSILVTGNQRQTEKLYNTLWHGPEFAPKVAILLDSMGPARVRRSLAQYNSGNSTILFTTTFMARKLGKVRADQIILYNWEHQDLSSIDFLVANTIPNGNSGAPGVVYIFINTGHGGAQLKQYQELYQTRDDLDFLEFDMDALIPAMSSFRSKVGPHINLEEDLPGGWAEEWNKMKALEKEALRRREKRELGARVPV